MTDTAIPTINSIDELLARWDAGTDKPFKGHLIDLDAYLPTTSYNEARSLDLTAPPPSLSCMCAQGQILHTLDKWPAYKLANTAQSIADRRVAELLGITVPHAVILRNINDSAPGAPSDVLRDPAKYLGAYTDQIIAFWKHLDAYTEEQWHEIPSSTGELQPLWDIVNQNGEIYENFLSDVEPQFCSTARSAANSAYLSTPAYSSLFIDHAISEIYAQDKLHEKNIPFTFLSLFGFKSPEELLTPPQKDAEQ